MTATTIEWTEETWNPTVGCSRVSPGCDGCYAISVAHRAMQPAHEGLTIKRPGERTDWTGVVRCLPERLEVPLRRRRPTMFFVDSMSDLFHPDVPDEFLLKVWGKLAVTPRHTYQILTKRPQRMADFMRAAVERWGDGSLTILRHVWLGTSIESDRYAFRADHLRATPAAVRFLSLEPLLGPLPSLDLTGIDWVIVGGESGPGARPMHPDWVRDIRDRCVAAGVPFFFKQWGAYGVEGPPERLVIVADDGTVYRRGDLDWPDGPRRGEAIRARNYAVGIPVLAKKREALTPVEKEPVCLDAEVRPVPGWPSLAVTAAGVVYGPRGRRKATPGPRSSPYLYVTVRVPGKARPQKLRLHHAVLLAWVGPRPEGMEGRHLDGDLTHNAVGNLAWSTHVVNIGDKDRHGTMLRGSTVGTARLTEADVRAMRALWPAHSLSALAKRFGVGKATVGQAVRRETWRHVS